MFGIRNQVFNRYKWIISSFKHYNKLHDNYFVLHWRFSIVKSSISSGLHWAWSAVYHNNTEIIRMSATFKLGGLIIHITINTCSTLTSTLVGYKIANTCVWHLHAFYYEISIFDMKYQIDMRILSIILFIFGHRCYTLKFRPMAFTHRLL